MENKENKKGTTLDKLASMVARGFGNANTKFDEIKSEMLTKNEFNSFKDDFHFLKKKVDKLDYQVDEVYDILKRFEENDILNLQKRVQVLEKAVRSLAAQKS